MDRGGACSATRWVEQLSPALHLFSRSAAAKRSAHRSRSRLGLAGPFVTGNGTGAAGAEAMKTPDATEVTSGEALPESGRPDSNRRRPAWEAGDPG